MWVREEAYIEHQVSLSGHTVLEPKAVGRDDEPLVTLFAFELRGDACAKIMHVELRRIEHDIGDVADRVEPFSLRANRLHHCIAAPHRMRPPGLGEAPDQGFLACLQ